jgi:hypothetical protein
VSQSIRDRSAAADRRRSIFIATLWAGAPPRRIFRRCSLAPYQQDMGLRSRLEISAAAELPAKYLVFRGQDTRGESCPHDYRFSTQAAHSQQFTLELSLIASDSR